MQGGGDGTTRVSEEKSLAISSVYAAVNVISSSLASFPLNLYEQNKNGSKDLALNHDQYYKVKTRPNHLYSSYTWRKTMISHMLLWGNGYSLIERKGGRPDKYTIIHPSEVEVTFKGGVLLYKLGGEHKTIVNPTEMVHFMGLSLDGITGLSVIQTAKVIMATGMNADKLTESLYKNGTFTRQYITMPEFLKDNEAIKRLRESWASNYGGAVNAGKTPVLEGGGMVKYMGMPLPDLQFIENKKFTVEDVARFFNIQPHKIGHLADSTFSNISEQNIEYVTDTLIPIATMMEQELNYKTLRENELGKFYFKFEFNALLRGTPAQRVEYYTKMYYLNSINANEIRSFEDMNPIEGGDKYWSQVNLIPLDRVDEYLDSIIEGKKGIDSKADTKNIKIPAELLEIVKHNGNGR